MNNGNARSMFAIVSGDALAQRRRVRVQVPYQNRQVDPTSHDTCSGSVPRGARSLARATGLCQYSGNGTKSAYRTRYSAPYKPGSPRYRQLHHANFVPTALRRAWYRAAAPRDALLGCPLFPFSLWVFSGARLGIGCFFWKVVECDFMLFRFSVPPFRALYRLVLWLRFRARFLPLKFGSRGFRDESILVLGH